MAAAGCLPHARICHPAVVAGTGEHTRSRKTPGSHVRPGSDGALCTGARPLPRGTSAGEAGYGAHGGPRGEPARVAATTIP